MWRKNKRKPLAQPEEEQQAASRASNPRNSNNDALAREEAMSRREELLHKMEEDNNKKLGEIARRELDASKAEEDAHKKKEQAIEREEEAIRREEYIAEREQSLAMKEEELARREEEIAAMELEVKRRAKQLSGEENIFTSQAPVIDETPSEHGTDYETTEPSIKAEYNPLDSLRISTGDLKFVPWKEASSLKPPDALHAAIEIPIGQPSRDDLVGTSDRLPQRDEPQRKEQPSDTSKHAPKKLFQRRGWQTDHLHVNPPEELPDRIRICSLRLGVYMDYNIHDTSLNRSTYRRTPYTIPRPFKILVEKNVEIREGLVELEKIRSRRSPGMTEADHDRAWKADMPQDLPEMDRFDGAKCNFAELTAMIKDLRCLVQFMDGYIAPTIQHIGASSQVYFSDLWFVFPARSLLYIRDKEVPQKIWKVIQRTGGTRDTVVSSRPSKRADRTHGFVPFYIDCFHLDHDGTRYIQMYRQIKIEYFEDYQPLASLPVIPFDVAQKLGYTDKQALARRGKEFVQCTTQPRHKQYTGRNQILRPNGGKLNEKDADVPESATRYAEWIESEVMVDFQRALQEIPNWRPKAKELDLFKALSPPRDYTGLDNDTIWDTKVSDQVADEAWEKCQTWDKTRTHPSEEQDLLLLPERVFGFVFRTRKWGEFLWILLNSYHSRVIE
jgi:ribosomal protein L36